MSDSDVTSSLLDGDLILRNIVNNLASESFAVVDKNISGYLGAKCLREPSLH